MFLNSGETDISEELVAAWLDGNLDPEADSAFLELLSSDDRLAEVLDAYDDVETEFESLIEGGYEIPSEFGFDFMLPEIEYADGNEMFVYHNDGYDGYESVADSHEMNEDDDDISQSSEIFDENDEGPSDGMDFF